MSKKEKKLIKKHAPSITLSGIICAAVILIAVLLFILPIFTLTYVEGGETVVANLSGLDLIELCIKEITGGFASNVFEEAPYFHYLVVASGDLNSIKDILWKSLVQYYPYVLLGIGGLLALVAFFTVFELIYVIKFLLVGKAHILGGGKTFSKLQFIFLLIFTLVTFLFHYLYSGLVMNMDETAEMGSFAIFWILLIASFACYIVLSIINKVSFKNAKVVSKKDLEEAE